MQYKKSLITKALTSLLTQKINSPLQQVVTAETKHHDIRLYIKRDDLIHPLISGNKWRKLKYNLIMAKDRNISTLVSFGGAYSNHIHALAAAGKIFNFKTTAIIRGEEDLNNPTLNQVKALDMQLKFVSRLEYKQRYNRLYLEQLQQQYPQALIIPEGGTNKIALKGVAEIINELSQQIDHVDFICTPCGSGGTTAGLISGADKQTKILSFSVLKNGQYLIDEINALVQPPDARCPGEQNTNWQFIDNYHFGGYGKFTPELITFIEQFYQQTKIKIEPIYSGKMFFGLFDLIKQGYFPAGSNIIAIHTGGLQGINGFKQRGLLPHDWLD